MKFSLSLWLLLAVASLTTGDPRVIAAPILNPATDHWYDAIRTSRGISWEEAKLLAESLGGYLATATTVEENLFIFTSFPDASVDRFGFWLGGFQPVDTADADADPAAGWAWVTGEPFDANLWIAFGSPVGEPNDFPFSDGRRQEDALHLFDFTGNWNDSPRIPELLQNQGFVVEFNRDPNSVPDSLPGWLPLTLSAALLGMAGGRRRRHQAVKGKRL